MVIINKKIGIFDSGVGGLTVLKHLLEILPNENYIYIGDNKNCPYGDKTKEELYLYAKRIIEYFISNDVKLIVVACNTICSTVLDRLQEEFLNVKIIGVIDPTVKEVIKSNTNNLLIIGTNATINSNIYEKKIREYDKQINIKSIKTPLLVPFIEERKQNIEDVLKLYMDDVELFDTILLGCTHYELISEKIYKIANKNIISSSIPIGKEVDIYLKENNILGNKSSYNIFTTGNVENFEKISKSIIDSEVRYLDL